MAVMHEGALPQQAAKFVTLSRAASGMLSVATAVSGVISVASGALSAPLPQNGAAALAANGRSAYPSDAELQSFVAATNRYRCMHGAPAVA